ncbi:hypothetical protein [Dickeya sp. ws52]|uniref:hypothetical protein n=1 Tax=Dickeya sp. ws52 TaxID=2576377 RepID=UPI00117CB94B|nr:hypothetical protein [Dickeya sp. ws52]TYL43919.1 hypothetical protein FDP13_03700 [Dickeya sp. ws52]
MGRPRKVEVPGSAAGADTTTETSSLSDATGTPVPPAGDAVITALEGADDSGVALESVNGSAAGADTTSVITARNEALSHLPASALEIITQFETLGFTDMADQPLTSNLQFIGLVKQATTQPAATKPVITEDGQRTPHKAPVLTEHGWHVPG